MQRCRSDLVAPCVTLEARATTRVYKAPCRKALGLCFVVTALTHIARAHTVRPHAMSLASTAASSLCSAVRLVWLQWRHGSPFSAQQASTLMQVRVWLSVALLLVQA